MSNKDHKSYENTCSRSEVSRLDTNRRHHRRRRRWRQRTPSATVSVLLFVSISITCIRMNDVANRMCWIYCVGFVFIGFIEYQGQIMALKSNILKRSSRISHEHRSHRAQFTHHRKIFTYSSSPSGYTHRSRHFRYISSTETVNITVNLSYHLVAQSRENCELIEIGFLFRFWHFFSLLYYLFAGYMCAEQRALAWSAITNEIALEQ